MQGSPAGSRNFIMKILRDKPHYLGRVSIIFSAIFTNVTSIISGGGGGGGRIVIDYVNVGSNNGLITAYCGNGGGTDGTLFFGQNPMVLTFPNVAIARVNPGSVILSWPVTATNYTLQTSPTIGPGSIWTPSPAGSVIGGNIILTNQVSDAGAFFRLKHN